MAEYDWPEHEYVEYLESERTNYAWTMRHYGGMSEVQARQAALESYPYEPPDAPYRGLHFNKQAWYWAIDRIAETQGRDRADFPAMRPECPGYVDPGSVEIDPTEPEALRRKLHGG